jgi:hypothetical protein
VKGEIMIKLIFSIGIALFSSANAAQEPKISIKGIEIGFSKAEVANITGTQERFARGFRVGGVYGDMALTYGNSGLSLAMFVFNSPAMFLTSFIIGCSYLVLRGRKKGWRLPKDIKNTH